MLKLHKQILKNKICNMKNNEQKNSEDNIQFLGTIPL